LNILKGRKLLS